MAGVSLVVRPSVTGVSVLANVLSADVPGVAGFPDIAGVPIVLGAPDVAGVSTVVRSSCCWRHW